MPNNKLKEIDNSEKNNKNLHSKSFLSHYIIGLGWDVMDKFTPQKLTLSTRSSAVKAKQFSFQYLLS